MAGLLPYEGRLSLDGESIASLGSRDRARRLAYVPQRSELASDLTVEDVVAQGRYAHGGVLGRLADRDRAAVDHALDAADLGALRDRPFPWLSEGERRRVLFARAIATGARTILLDEPTAALDIRHALELFSLLRSLAEAGCAIAVVLHDLDDALRFSDRALVLHEGRAIAFGPVAEVVTAEVIERVYDVEVRQRSALGFHRRAEMT
jgi:iron complex transport system ATP-binding protein